MALRERPAAVVCRGSPGTKFFTLVKKDGRYAYRKLRTVSQHGSQGPEARRRIPAVSESAASRYVCLHRQGSCWVVFRKPLGLMVTVKDVSTLSSGLPPGPCTLSPSMSSVSGWFPAVLLSPPALWVPCTSEHMFLGLHAWLRALKPWTPLDTTMAWTRSIRVGWEPTLQGWGEVDFQRPGWERPPSRRQVSFPSEWC